MNTIVIRNSSDEVRHVIHLDKMHTASMDGNKLSIHFDNGHIWYIEGEDAQKVANHIAKATNPWYLRFWRWGCK
jgi:hypothetical protein